MRKFAILLSALVVAACAQDIDRQPAESAVNTFHSRLDAGHFESIYDTAAPAFRNAVRRDTFVALLAGVHGSLGAVKSTTQKHWTTKVRSSDALVTLDYATTFANGEATEHFAWRLEGDRVELAHYDVSSKSLAHN
jgi:hypothetical protein